MRETNQSNRWFNAAMVIVCFLTASEVGLAADINVPADHSTIRLAINSAADGDVIIVADGIYINDGDKNLDFGGRAITVRSANGPINCIIDCKGKDTVLDRAFYFHSGEEANSVVQGFTIKRGYSDKGGAIYCNNSSPTINNCIITGNEAFLGGAVYNESSSPTFVDCTFSENESTEDDDSGGAMYNINSNPELLNCIFINNVAAGYGGGMDNQLSNPRLLDCMFTDNSARIGGGMFNMRSEPNVSSCIFTGNSAEVGGAMTNERSSSIVLNCLFNGNTADDGGGMGNYTYSYFPGGAVLTNCTFSNNSANNFGGGIRNYGNGDNPTLTNCILWGNSDSNGIVETSQILSQQGAVTINYSCVQGWMGGLSGIGNDGNDPLFVDIDGIDGIFGNVDDDLRLGIGSPCIDAGDNTAVPPSVTLDLDGEERFMDDHNVADTGNGTAPIVDMGAYEGAHDQPPRLWYVDDNGPNDPGPGDPCVSDPNENGSIDHPFDSIQQAVDEANNLDSVIVFKGTYTGVGNYDIDPNGKSITIRSVDPIDLNIVSLTIIDPCQAGRGFYFNSGEDNNTVIAGFTITGGYVAGFGGAVFCEQSGPAIKNCVLTGNYAGVAGGGIWIDANSFPVIRNCTISYNECETSGGGICCAASYPVIENCLITYNEGYYSGAASSIFGGNMTVVNCTISENSASSGSGTGGIYCWKGDAVITNTILWGNLGSISNQIKRFQGDEAVIVSYSDVQMADSNDVWDDEPNNINTDPCFADANGSDYHLKSQAGRWQQIIYISCDFNNDCIVNLYDFAQLAENWERSGFSLTGDIDSNDIVNYNDLYRFTLSYLTAGGDIGGWVTDGITSLCIDAGDPNSDYQLEPIPNGAWINMGAYGNTKEASKSPTP